MDDSKYQIDLLTALNERLMSSEKMYRHVSECTGNLFMHFDYKISPARVDLIGPWDDVLGEKVVNQPYDESYMIDFVFDEDQDEFRNRILNADKHHINEDTMEIRSRNKSFCFVVKVFVNYDSNDNPIEKIIQFIDVSKEKANSEELEYLAYYDSLTGVYNRNYFFKQFRSACEKADIDKTSVEVLFIDIDDFKNVNDTQGLIYGDELVQELGQFLGSFNSSEITVGRFGSDVFVVYVYNPCGTRSAGVIYKRIQDRLRKPFVLSNRAEVYITVTAGIAEYPDAGKTSFEVMKNAEIILYEAKEKGNNSVLYFDPNIIIDANRNATIESELSKAIGTNELVCYYQPQYYSENGKLRGVELLLRWPYEDSENYEQFKSEPSEFIKIAEHSKLIIPLGEYVLKEAVKNITEWRSKYHIPFKVCINISSVQLNQENFVESVQQLIQMFDVNPELIELELSENLFINDYQSLNDKIKTLRGIGINIAIDNFGINNGSLQLINEVAFDTLKIDKRMLRNALQSDASDAILESLIELADKLHIETVAECVETRDEFNYLRKNYCDVIQGFLLGKPMNKTEFEKILIRQMP